jgi:predicted RNA-binding Zn-ribbon protein involved in translation (DUF1610 family)
MWGRSDRYRCLDCGFEWSVPRRVRVRKQKWRGGGYGYADSHAAGARAMSNAYQGYLTDMKNQRSASREADMELASAAGVCPNCGSTRH